MSSLLENKQNVDTTKPQASSSMSFFIHAHNDNDNNHNNNNNNVSASTTTTPPAAQRLRAVALTAPAPRTPSPRKLVKHTTTPSNKPRPCPFELAERIAHADHGHQNKTTTKSEERQQQQRIRTVYLIRHGESIGQTCSRETRINSCENNNNNATSLLLDCGLTENGRQQARSMLFCLDNNDKAKAVSSTIRLVLCSPLTRALETAILAFSNNINIPIVIHYELRELGRMIPENIPRPIDEVLNDLLLSSSLLPDYGDCSINNNTGSSTCTASNNNAAAAAAADSSTTATTSSIGQQQTRRLMIDTETFRPDQWPRNHDTPPKVVRRDRIRQIFQWLASSSQPDDNDDVDHHYSDDDTGHDNDDDDDFAVAVVCHYHVIRAALSNPHCARKLDISPENAKPIKCRLHKDGRLTVIDNDDYNVTDSSPLPRIRSSSRTCDVVINNNNNSPSTSTSSSDHGDYNRYAENKHAASQSSLLDQKKNLDEDFMKERDS